MLVSKLGEIDVKVEMKSFKNFEYCIEGVIFSEDYEDEKKTLEFIIDFYNDFGEIPFEKLYGGFILLLKNRDTEEIIIFTDNSNIRTLYYSKDYVSNDFLKIVKEDKFNKLDFEGLSHYLLLGEIYLNKTLFKNINNTKNTEYIIIRRDKVSIENKEIKNIDSNNKNIRFDSFFDSVSKNICDKKITMDLTGGYDSRLVFSMLKDKGLDINLFISGKKDSKDVLIAKKISKITKYYIDFFQVKKSKLNEKKLWELFEFGETIYSLKSSYRIKNFAEFRKNKGYNLRITGDGGVLYKDWWWIQDFPLYNKKKIDVDKFYKQRIKLTNINRDLFTDSVKESMYRAENNIINNIVKLKKETNTKSYDFFYFNLKGNLISKANNCFSKYIPIYSPLWEKELVSFSYDLKRKDRFFYNFIRKMITKNAPELSKIRTEYGMNASNNFFDKIIDSYFFIKQYFVKAFRYFKRRFLNKNYKSDVDIDDFYDDIRKMDILDKAIGFFKKNNFLKESVKKEDLSDNLIDRILNVYMLIEYGGKK
jgi:hypothetical protein